MAKNKKVKVKDHVKEYINASRHGEWLANNEDATGFISINKVFRSKKAYTRKQKFKIDC